jgi:hypothetical protein
MPEEIQPSPTTIPATEKPSPTPIAEIPYPPPKPEKKPSFFERFWYLFVIAAIICLLLVGVLWKLTQSQVKTPPVTPTPTPTEAVDQSTQALESQGTSDDLGDIEADLNATDFTDLDKELSDIENELSQ